MAGFQVLMISSNYKWDLGVYHNVSQWCQVDSTSLIADTSLSCTVQFLSVWFFSFKIHARGRGCCLPSLREWLRPWPHHLYPPSLFILIYLFSSRWLRASSEVDKIFNISNVFLHSKVHLNQALGYTLVFSKSIRGRSVWMKLEMKQW